MALPSWAGGRAWGAGGAPCLNEHPRLKLPPQGDGDAPTAKGSGSPTGTALAAPASPCRPQARGRLGAFCPVLLLQREKTCFLIMSWLFWGSGGCRRWAGGPRRTGGNNGATVWPNAPASVRKAQRGVFSMFLFPCSGIITQGNKEPFKPAHSPQHSPGGAASIHACRLPTGCKGMVTRHSSKGSPAGPVTLGSGVGTNIPRSPGTHGRGRGAPLPYPRSWLCPPGQKAKSKSRPAPQSSSAAGVNGALCQSGFDKALFPRWAHREGGAPGHFFLMLLRSCLLCMPNYSNDAWKSGLCFPSLVVYLSCLKKHFPSSANPEKTICVFLWKGE